MTTTYGHYEDHEKIAKCVLTLYPETNRPVGYSIRKTTMEAFAADGSWLGSFPGRDLATDAILAAYLKRRADE